MNRSGQRESGQALPEFALVAPLFFILVFGVIQFGIVFGGQVALGNAAREVARYASTLPAGQTVTAIRNQADPIFRGGIPAYNGSAVANVAYCYYTNPTSPVTYSQKVTITITYGHTLFIPLVGALIDGVDGTPGDNRFTTTVREEMKVEAQPLKSVPSGTVCGVNP